MVLIAVDLHAQRNLCHLAIDTHSEITLATHGLEELTIVTLTIAYQRSQDKDSATGIVVLNHLYHSFLGIFHHRLTSHIAVSLTRTGIKQSQIVVNLGGSAYGRTRVLVGGLLLNADNGRQTGNLINIRTLHTPKKIAGIGRKGLDIATLTLGKDGVEGQRRFAGTTQSGNDCERLTGYLDINILQIMDTSTPDAYLFVILNLHWYFLHLNVSSTG